MSPHIFTYYQNLGDKGRIDIEKVEYDYKITHMLTKLYMHISIKNYTCNMYEVLT